MTERELFEKTIVDKCGFSPEASFELSSVTGDYKSDVVYFAWLMWQASAKREGFVLVPKKCTNNMAHAAKSIDARLSVFKYSDVWDAMLSAVEVQNGLD